MTEYEENDLLWKTWEDNKDNFMKWINLICGFSINSDIYLNLNRLILDEVTISEWVCYFDGDLDNVAITTERFIEYRSMTT